MTKFWLRHPDRDHLFGPAPLEELLRDVVAAEPLEPWQVMEAQGQTYHALKNEFGWQPLTQQVSPEQINAVRQGAGLADPPGQVPAALGHMQDAVRELLDGMDRETRTGPDARRWAWLLLQAGRNHSAYRGLRSAISWLAILLWALLVLMFLLQLGAFHYLSGPEVLPLLLLWGGSFAAAALLVHVVKHLALVLIDIADLQLERQRQSGRLPGRPIDD